MLGRTNTLAYSCRSVSVVDNFNTLNKLECLSVSTIFRLVYYPALLTENRPASKKMKVERNTSAYARRNKNIVQNITMTWRQNKLEDLKI